MMLFFLLAASAGAEESVIATVRKALESDYYDQKLAPLDWSTVRGGSESELYASLNRVLAQLKDGHTSAVPPTAVRNRKAASRLGLGFEGRFLEGKLAVVAVQEASPVAQAGVQRGWVVRSVNRQRVPATEADFGPWIRELRVGELCEAGSVELEFLDGADREQKFTSSCALLAVQPVRQATLTGDRLLVRMDDFDAESAKWFESVVDSHPSAKRMILDLRQNGGGQKSALLRVANRLFPDKVLLGRSLARRGKVTEWKAGGQQPFRGELTVLIDSATQSAAEILAAAVQESGRGKVLGRPSGGSVLVMIRRPLPDGGELRLSVEDFLTARGRRLEGNGVKPDVELPLGLAQLRSSGDGDLLALP